MWQNDSAIRQFGNVTIRRFDNEKMKELDSSVDRL